MAAAKAAQAARQTGCGWDSAESSLATRAASSGSLAQTPMGAMRINEPLLWLRPSAWLRAAWALSAAADAAGAKARPVV